MTEIPHGTKSRYSSARYRCRCEECKAASAAYQRAWREAREAPSAKSEEKTMTPRPKPERVAPERCLHITERGRCTESAGHGLFLNFCAEHAAYFAEMRVNMKRSLGRTNRWRHDEDLEDAA